MTRKGGARADSVSVGTGRDAKNAESEKAFASTTQAGEKPTLTDTPLSTDTDTKTESDKEKPNKDLDKERGRKRSVEKSEEKPDEGSDKDSDEDSDEDSDRDSDEKSDEDSDEESDEDSGEDSDEGSNTKPLTKASGEDSDEETESEEYDESEVEEKSKQGKRDIDRIPDNVISTIFSTSPAKFAAPLAFIRSRTCVSRIAPMVFQEVPNEMISYLNYLRHHDAGRTSQENVQLWVLGKTQPLFYDYFSGERTPWSDVCDNVFVFQDGRVFSAPQKQLETEDVYTRARFKPNSATQGLKNKDSFVVGKFEYKTFVSKTSKTTFVETKPMLSKSSYQSPVSCDKMQTKITQCKYIIFVHGVPEEFSTKSYRTVDGVIPRSPDWSAKPCYFLPNVDWKVWGVAKKQLLPGDSRKRDVKVVRFQKTEYVYEFIYSDSTYNYRLTNGLTIGPPPNELKDLITEIFGKEVYISKG